MDLNYKIGSDMRIVFAKNALLLISIFGGVAACSSSPKKVEFVEPEQSLKVAPTQASKVIDPSSKVVGTSNNIQVSDIRTSSFNNQLLIQIELKNNRGRRDVVNYRIRWLDANGLQVMPYDSWQIVSLEGYESSVLNLTSPRPEATDFRFEIKPYY